MIDKMRNPHEWIMGVDLGIWKDSHGFSRCTSAFDLRILIFLTGFSRDSHHRSTLVQAFGVRFRMELQRTPRVKLAQERKGS